jgi:hypothetical protein
MALKHYKHKVTGEVKRSLKDPGDEWETIIEAPNQKFMVSANAATGTSKLKDSTKVLTERARNHSRDHDLDDNIQINSANGIDVRVKTSFLNEKGERRRKIDDI